MKATFYRIRNNDKYSVGIKLYKKSTGVNVQKIVLSDIPKKLITKKPPFLVINAATTDNRRYLQNLETALNNYIINLKTDYNRLASSNELKDKIKELTGVTTKKDTLSQYVNKYFEENKVKKLAYSTKSSKKLHLDFMINCLNDCNIYTLNNDSFKIIKDKLLEINKERATINNYTKNIKVFLNWLHKVNDIDIKQLSKSQYLEKEATPKKTIIALTDSDRNKIFNAVFKENELQEILDLFKLNLLIGVRYSDLKQINKNTVFKKNGVYIYQFRIKKTSEEIDVPLSNLSLSIIRKYNYNFKIPSNRKANKLLKEIFKKLNIDNQEKVTTIKDKIEDKHVKLYEIATFKLARKTFITHALENNFSLIEVKHVTGHASQAIFDYIKKNNKKLSEKLNMIDPVIS